MLEKEEVFVPKQTYYLHCKIAGKDSIVDKICTDTQRQCAACGPSTKFACIKYNVGLHQTIMAKGINYLLIY